MGQPHSLSDPFAFAGVVTPQNTAAQQRHPARVSEWTPAAEETFLSSHADYAALRATNPFPWSSAYGGFWAAMTYDDVCAVLLDDDAFVTSVQNVVPHVPRVTRRPPLHYDPPEHTEYRVAIDPVFRASAIRPHHPAFRATANELIDDLLNADDPDFTRDVAVPYAIACFATVLGIEMTLARHIRTVGSAYSFAIQAMDPTAIDECSRELYTIAESIYHAPRDGVDPESDLVSRLRAAAGSETSGISDATAIACIRQLIAAGMAAPQATLGSAVVHLAMHPELQDHLRATPGDIPAAIEELLRLYSPYRVFARTATRDLELHGRDIREGEPVALIFPSANRDETVFDRPDDFVLRRPGNSHLAFGRGSHKCPAAPLARAELAIALETLLDRTRSFALAGEVTMINWLEYGPSAIPLRIEH